MPIREAPPVLTEVVKWLIDRMDVQLFTWGFRHKKEYTGEALLALDQVMRVGLSPDDQAIVTEIVRKSLRFLECEIGYIEGKPIRGGWFDPTRYDELIAAQALYAFGRGLGPSMQPVFWNQLKRYVNYQISADKEYSVFAVCLAIFCVSSYTKNVRAQNIGKSIVSSSAKYILQHLSQISWDKEIEQLPICLLGLGLAKSLLPEDELPQQITTGMRKLEVFLKDSFENRRFPFKIYSVAYAIYDLSILNLLDTENLSFYAEWLVAQLSNQQSWKGQFKVSCSVIRALSCIIKHWNLQDRINLGLSRRFITKGRKEDVSSFLPELSKVSYYKASKLVPYVQGWSEDKIELLLRTLFDEKKNASVTLDVSGHSGTEVADIYPMELADLRTAVIIKGPSFGPTLGFKDVCYQTSKVLIRDPIIDLIIVVSSVKPSNQFEYELQKFAEIARCSMVFLSPIDLTKLLLYHGYLKNTKNTAT